MYWICCHFGINLFKQKYEEEAEWEGSRGKKRKRKRGKARGRPFDPDEELSLSCRSRPINLRQRPRARYNDDLEDLGLSSDDEPKPKPKKRQWTVVSDSSGESDQEETAEKPEDGSNAAEGEDEGVVSNSPLPAQPESLTRAQQKNPRAKRGGKKACLLSCLFLTVGCNEMATCRFFSLNNHVFIKNKHSPISLLILCSILFASIWCWF